MQYQCYFSRNSLELRADLAFMQARSEEMAYELQQLQVENEASYWTKCSLRIIEKLFPLGYGSFEHSGKDIWEYFVFICRRFLNYTCRNVTTPKRNPLLRTNSRCLTDMIHSNSLTKGWFDNSGFHSDSANLPFVSCDGAALDRHPERRWRPDRSKSLIFAKNWHYPHGSHGSEH